MKRFFAAFLALMMVFTIAAFGGSALAASDNVGTYKLTAMDEGDESVSAEDLELMESLGLTCELYLQEDGTGALVLFGESTDLTWDDAAITAEGDSIPYTVDGDVLTIADDDIALIFTKVSDEVDIDAGDAPAAGVSDSLPGTYQMSEANPDAYVDPEYMENMDSIRMYLAPDGTGTFDLMGEIADVTWDDTYITAEGDSVEYSLEDGVLTLYEDGEMMLAFTKISDDADTGAAAAPAAAPAAGDYYAEPLAEGDVGEYHVAIVGAEAFTDTDDKDAVRFYYEFTNTSDEETTAWWELTWDAEQEGYELVSTYASWEDDAPEYGNDDLHVMPGATVLCISEFNFKPSGGDLTFTISDYGDDPVSYTFTDAANLPGRPMLWTPAPVEDPQFFADYDISGETDNIAVAFTDAEVVSYDGIDFLRVYFDVTNYTDEAESPLWLTTFRAYQDGVELSDDDYLPFNDTDSAYYDDLEPGATVQASCAWTLRSDNPVEVTVIDYVDYGSDILCAATIDIDE